MVHDWLDWDVIYRLALATIVVLAHSLESRRPLVGAAASIHAHFWGRDGNRDSLGSGCDPDFWYHVAMCAQAAGLSPVGE